MRLDVGCGNNPHGDVNIDKKSGEWVNHVCDAETLPFPDNSFEEVYSKYMIEHCLNPVKAIKEMIRIAQKKVTIITNDIHFPIYLLQYVVRKGFYCNEPEHKWGWSRYYMENLLRAMNITGFTVRGISVYGSEKKDKFIDKIAYKFLIRPLKPFLKSDIEIVIKIKEE